MLLFGKRFCTQFRNGKQCTIHAEKVPVCDAENRSKADRCSMVCTKRGRYLALMYPERACGWLNKHSQAMRKITDYIVHNNIQSGFMARLLHALFLIIEILNTTLEKEIETISFTSANILLVVQLNKGSGIFIKQIKIYVKERLQWV